MKEIDFSRYLDGNPAMLEIWSDAMDRIEKSEPLAPVQRVVVREWLFRASARLMELQLRAQHSMLPEVDYAELAALEEQTKRLKEFQ